MSNPYSNLTARQASVRRYFTPTPRFPRMIGTALLATIGLILFVVGLGSTIFIALVGVVILVVTAWKAAPRILRYRRLLALAEPKPTDHQMDMWLTEALGPARDAGFRRLHLTPSDLLKPEEPPLLVIGFPEDYEFPDHFARGKDGILRSAYYHLLVIYMTEWHLSTYRCVLQMETGAFISDQTHEFAYRDIVSVATTSDRITVRLPIDHSKRVEDPADATGEGNAATGQQTRELVGELTTEQWFRLRVASDETKLRVCVINFAFQDEESAIDGALRQIRGRLREYTRLHEQGPADLKDVHAKARRRDWDS